MCIRDSLTTENVSKLEWLFSEAKLISQPSIEGNYVGPRREMITPWRTNAVEITQNMGISGILRIEEFRLMNPAAPQPDKGGVEPEYVQMLERVYVGLNQDIFTINKQPEPILFIDDVAAYNDQEGLALSADEIEYLNQVSICLLYKYRCV